MEIRSINEFTGGWFIGDFSPTVLKTSEFEVCYKEHQRGEKWPVHLHKIATEINYLISGIMTIGGKMLNTGDIFIIRPGEISDPVFHTMCKVLVVKVPSVKDDKYEIL